LITGFLRRKPCVFRNTQHCWQYYTE
jgi:hypothetical protein